MFKFVASAVILIGLSAYEASALQCWACSSDIDRSCADIFNSTDIYRYGGGYYQESYQSSYSRNDPYNQQRQYGDNRDYYSRDSSRDQNNRDGNRDPYFDRDRSRDPYNRDYNNRDYNNRDYRDPQSRDGNRDLNRDPYRDNNRDPYNRDPNNRDYPPRDYNRDYNQGRNFDPNYPPRDYNYGRSQAFASSQTGGPRLVTCNEEEARLRRMRNVCIKKVQRIGDNQLTYIRRCEMISYDKEIGTCYEPVARGISLDFCEYCEYDGCNSATGLKFNVILASLVPMVLFWAFFS